MSKTLEGMEADARHDMAFSLGLLAAAAELGYFIREEEGGRIFNRLVARASSMRLEARAALRAAAGGGKK